MVHEEEILQIVQSIWMSILDLEIRLDSSADGRLREGTGRSLTGCVQLTGDFEGAALLDCTGELARRVAAVMFEEQPDALSIAEVQDALGELTNMVAGNIKPLLSGSSRLSLPSVVEGSDYSVIVPGSRALLQVGFECEGEPLMVTLAERRREK